MGDSPRWARVLACLALLAALMEIGSRAGIRLWAGEPFHSFEPYRWSPYGLVRNNPELTSPAFKISPQGFRSLAPVERKKPPNTLRVLILGGSVAYSGLGRVVLPGRGRVGSDATIANYLESELRADPALAGVRVEVINAGINYDTIVEISTAYMVEWVNWDADVVVVMGSANNFGYAPPAGSIVNRQYGIQIPHPWEAEFQRLVNRQDLQSFVERAVRSLAHASAAVALLTKVISKLIDGARTAPPPPPPGPPAGLEEFDRYVDEYLGYTDAMVAVAHRRGQEMAFFWEYFIAHLDGIRPFNADERFLYEANKQWASLPIDRDYDFHARDRVRARLGELNVPLVDPMDALKTDPSTIFIDYLHYTADGNRVMAGVIHRQLSAVFRRRGDMHHL